MKFILSVLKRAPNAQNSVREVGSYEALEDTIAAAQEIVNATLLRLHTAGMTADKLVDRYREAGETPYIARDDDQTMNANSFNHFQYAKARSVEICGGG